ncbi:hypothetical protein B566_EDAN009781 [Ephemera danica]|nr:hypothetical protein B566_EDAN009781 [Ephemera danica]
MERLRVDKVEDVHSGGSSRSGTSSPTLLGPNGSGGLADDSGLMRSRVDSPTPSSDNEAQADEDEGSSRHGTETGRGSRPPPSPAYSHSSAPGSPLPPRSTPSSLPPGTATSGSPTPEATHTSGSANALRPPVSLAGVSPFSSHLFPSFDSSSGFRPVLEAGSAATPRTGTNPPPPLFFPPHLTSHLSSQFAPPLFPGLKAFPGLCSCCPIKPSSLASSLHSLSPGSGLMNSLAAAAAAAQEQEQRSSSVAELRRKAQEHSAALLHSLHHVASMRAHQHHQQGASVAAAAVASLHSALQSQPMNLHQALQQHRKSPAPSSSPNPQPCNSAGDSAGSAEHSP